MENVVTAQRECMELKKDQNVKNVNRNVQNVKINSVAQDVNMEEWLCQMENVYKNVQKHILHINLNVKNV